MLRACSALLLSIEKQFLVIKLSVDFSRAEVPSLLNELFNIGGPHGVREEKDYHRIDMVSHLFVCF